MRIDVGGYEMAVEGGAPRPGRRVALVLHGFAGSRHDWTPMVPQFMPLFNPLLVDAIGHGDSDSPTDGDQYTFDAVSDALDRLLGRLGHEAVVGVGYSFGARLLLHFALRHPRRISGLVLESVHPGLADPTARVREDAADATLLETKGLDAFLDAWHQRPIFESRRAQPGWAAEVARKRASNRPEALARCLRGLGLGSQRNLVPRLGDIRHPVLLLAGARDQAYVEEARRAASRLANAEIRILPTAGHSVHQDAPEAYLNAIRPFLARIAVPAPNLR